MKTIFLLISVVSAMIAASAHAQDACNRVDAYWNTNLSRLQENISACDTQNWQKCSQAAAIHYSLNSGSLAQRAQSCGLQKPEVPGGDVTKLQSADSSSCVDARIELRRVFKIRSLARMACAAARVGGENQEWLDAQCSYHRSQMVNYHFPFREVVQQCQLDDIHRLALLDQ